MKVLRIVLAWFLMIFLLSSSVVINVLQVLSFCAVFLPFKSRLAFNQSLSNSWWNLFSFVVEVYCGISYRFTGDRALADNAILIGNHEHGMDFISGVALTNRAGVGCGKMMTMMKRSLMYVPTVGWTHLLQGSLFLKRDWQQDSASLSVKLQDMDQKRFPEPFWIGMYPEGTRMTPKKLADSQEFAKQKGLPVLNHVLIPRTKGFVFIKKSLPATLSSIYDVTTAYIGGALYLTHFLFTGDFKTREVHCNVKRILYKDTPSETELDKWLMNVFVEKDQLLEGFSKTNSFAGTVVNYPSQIEALTKLFITWAVVLGLLLFVSCKSWVWVLLFAILCALTLNFSRALKKQKAGHAQ